MKDTSDQESRTRVRSAVIKCLCDRGWTELPGPGGPALATKQFATAVGDRQAAAYLQDWGAKSKNWGLAGDYRSEGRNALEPHGVLIPKDSSADDVRRLATQFVTRADAAIAQTYAARLHRTDRSLADHPEVEEGGRPSAVDSPRG